MKKITIRAPNNIHAAIKASAKRNFRSLNGEIVKALAFYLKHSPGANYFVGGPGKEATQEEKPTED